MVKTWGISLIRKIFFMTKNHKISLPWQRNFKIFDNFGNIVFLIAYAIRIPKIYSFQNLQKIPTKVNFWTQWTGLFVWRFIPAKNKNSVSELLVTLAITNHKYCIRHIFHVHNISRFCYKTGNLWEFIFAILLHLHSLCTEMLWSENFRVR